MPPDNRQNPSQAESYDHMLNVMAQTSNFGGSMASGGESAMRVPMLYIDPLFDTILILFPQDNIRELNRRLRHYYKYQPYVRNAVDLHTEIPLSDFFLECEAYKEAQEYYNDFKDRKNLTDVVTDVLRDYWLLGEGFSFGNWDDFDTEFDDFVQIPPEEMAVHSAYVTSRRAYVMRPNTELGKLMSSNNQADRALARVIRQTSPEQAEKILRNQPHMLDSNRLIVMQRKMAAYSNRGMSPVLSVVKDLLFEDHLNMFRTVFIQRHSYPMKIYKIGDKEKGWIPPASMYLDFRRQLLNSVADPDFNLITHPFVTMEYVTGHDKILPLGPYYDLVKQRVFAGLFINDAMVGGDKSPYAGGMTFMRGLMYKYLTIRNTLDNELKRKVFLTLARMKKLQIPKKADVDHRVKTKLGERKYIIPKIFWQKANLLANSQMISTILAMREKGDAPLRYVTDLFGWNFDDVMDQLKREESTFAEASWRKLKDKYIQDRKPTQDDVLSGKKIDEVLKKKYKDEIVGKKPKEDKPDRTSKFKAPEVPELPPTPAVGGIEGELPELEAGGGGETERTPRPSEEGGGIPPGGAAP